MSYKGMIYITDTETKIVAMKYEQLLKQLVGGSQPNMDISRYSVYS